MDFFTYNFLIQNNILYWLAKDNIINYYLLYSYLIVYFPFLIVYLFKTLRVKL